MKAHEAELSARELRLALLSDAFHVFSAAFALALSIALRDLGER